MPFKVTDKQTGRIATFDNKPTELDLQEAFGADTDVDSSRTPDISIVSSGPVRDKSLVPSDVQSPLASLKLAEQQTGVTQPQDIQPLQDELTLGQAGRLAIENFVPSAQQFGSDIFQAVKNPKQTVKAFGSLVSGTAELLIPGEQGNEEVAIAFGKFISDRYGSTEAMKRTLAEDPVGFAADLSTFVTGFGAVAGVTGKAGQLSKITQIKKAADIVVKSGQGIRKVGAVIDPVGLVSEGVRQAVKARGPINTLAKTALNIKADLPVRTVDRIAQEFMNRGLNVNRRSLKKLDIQNAKLNKTIQSTIDNSIKSKTPIKTDNIIKVIDELKENAAREGLSATNLKMLDNLTEDFGLIKGQTITPSQAQDLKVGFNKAYSESLTDQFGAIRAKFFDKARIGTKTELEKVWPELKQLNLDEGAGIELSSLINKAVNSIEKSPIVKNLGLAAGGIGGGIAVGGIVGVGEGVAFAVTSAIVGKLLSDPANGVKIAKILRTARKGAEKAPVVTRPAFQAGRVERTTQQQPEFLAPQITR